MKDFYNSLPISAQFSVVRFTVNSQQSTVNIMSSATGIDIKLFFASVPDLDETTISSHKFHDFCKSI